MKYVLLFSAFLFTLSCTTSDSSQPSDESDIIIQDNWTVSPDDIYGSDDPYPLIINPVFTEASTIDFLPPSSLVAIAKMNDEIKVFPYEEISIYESINDLMSNTQVAFTYCPQTKSGLFLDRASVNSETQLRASGYLYKDNLVAYDEATKTFWSQMLKTCIRGDCTELDFTHINFIETTWQTVKTFFPEAMVYINPQLTHSSNPDDVEIPVKPYGILESDFKEEGLSAHLFNMDSFSDNIELKSLTINSTDQSGKTVVVGSKNYHFITNFITSNAIEFQAIQNEFPIIMSDNNGNTYDVFGYITEGPDMGQKLNSQLAYFALDWAWTLFFDTLIEQN